MNEHLSPTAQAVLDAFLNGYNVFASNPECSVAYESDRNAVAAALEVVVDQVVPIPKLPYNSCCDIYVSAIRAELLAITAELRAQ